jgi:hypothetical protein
MFLRQPPEYYNQVIDTNMDGAFVVMKVDAKKVYDGIAWKEDYGSEVDGALGKWRNSISIMAMARVYSAMCWAGFKPNRKEAVVELFRCARINYPLVEVSYIGTFSKVRPISYIAPPARPTGTVDTNVYYPNNTLIYPTP